MNFKRQDAFKERNFMLKRPKQIKCVACISLLQLIINVKLLAKPILNMHAIAFIIAPMTSWLLASFSEL